LNTGSTCCADSHQEDPAKIAARMRETSNFRRTTPPCGEEQRSGDMDMRMTRIAEYPQEVNADS
jgi:hypothetical protein